MTYDSVSFKSEAHSILNTAADQKSPIKLTGYKRKANFRDNTLQDIEINKKTAVTLMENAPFKYSSASVPLAKTVTLKSLKDNSYDKQVVTIIGYLDIKDCYQSTFNEHSTLKEVYCNDASSETITLCLWNDCISQVNESGVYTIGNVVIKRTSAAAEPTLSTTKDTVIKPSKKVVKHIPAKHRLNNIMEFPITDFIYSGKKVRCRKCNLTCDITPGRDFQKCQTCGVYSKYSNLPVLRSARLNFGDDDQVLFYDLQLKEYAQKYDLDIDCEDKFTEFMLKDNQTRVIVNGRKICVCIL